MKTLFCIVSFGLLSATAFAQLPAKDTLLSSAGEVLIQPIYHGALALQWDNKTILADPGGGAKKYKHLSQADLVLITDIHQDHLDRETLDALVSKKTILVVPEAVAKLLPPALSPGMKILNNGDSMVWKGMGIKAVPMYNLPEDENSRHTKGRGNGYLLTIGDKNIYISGDTEDIPEMRALKHIDVAFLCMNEPYTMSVEQAAAAVLAFKPAVVYPYHYRGKNGLSDTAHFRQLVKKGNAEVEVRLRDWYTGGN